MKNMSDNFRGAVLMMICMAAFVLNDAFVRLAGDSLPLAQILFFRGLLTTIALLLVAFYTGVFKIKVPSQDKPTADAPRILLTLLCISLAALFVKVTAKI